MPLFAPPYNLIIPIVLIGAALRLYHLGEPSLWYDEAASVCLAQQHVDFTLASIGPDKNTDPPLFLYVVRGWDALTGLASSDVTSVTHDFLLRLLPCLAGVVCIALVFLLTRVLTDDYTISAIAAFLCAISPFQVYYAQELRTHTIYTGLCLLTVYATINALRDNKLRHWISITIFMSMMMYLHYASLWFIAAVNVYCLLTFKTHRARLRPWIISQSAVLAMILPALLTASHISTYFENIKYNWFPVPTVKTALITFKTFFAGYSPNVAAYWFLCLAAAALTGYGCYTYRKHWDRLTLLLSLLLVPITASLIIWNITFPMYEHRLFIFSGAIACILVAIGLKHLPKRLSYLALAAFTVATIPCLADVYAHRLHPIEAHRIGVWDKVQVREAAAFINAHAQPGDCLGHPSHFTWYSFRHYCPLPQMILAYTEADLTAMVDTFGCESVLRENKMMPQLIGNAAHSAERIWLADASGLVFHPPERVAQYRAWLEAHGTLELSKNFDKISVSCYRIHK